MHGIACGIYIRLFDAGRSIQEVVMVTTRMRRTRVMMLMLMMEVQERTNAKSQRRLLAEDSRSVTLVSCVGRGDVSARERFHKTARNPT
jgi:hypothetical protein